LPSGLIVVEIRCNIMGTCCLSVSQSVGQKASHISVEHAIIILRQRHGGGGGLTVQSLLRYLTLEIIQNDPVKTDMHAASIGVYAFCYN
jgi:hypothetical protein